MPKYNTWCYFHSPKSELSEVYLSDSEKIVFVNYGDHCPPMNCSVIGENIYGIEIIASSKEKANHIADLIVSSHTVVDGYNHERTEEIIRRFDKDPSNILSQIGTIGAVYGDEALLYACQMVQKVYGNQRRENAVCKYYVAHEIYSLHPMDLHPWEDPFMSEYLLTDRIRIANVVINCYSILEELHLQIKASQDNPSVIEGQWNPTVKEELSNRLEEKHISPNKVIPWLTRNGFIRPFKSTVIKHETLCEWSDGKEIFDFEINICDAILELSYIRSYIASHQMDKDVLKLSVYDAENAFAVVRFLLLDYFEIDWMKDVGKDA